MIATSAFQPLGVPSAAESPSLRLHGAPGSIHKGKLPSISEVRGILPGLSSPNKLAFGNLRIVCLAPIRVFLEDLVVNYPTILLNELLHIAVESLPRPRVI